MPLQFSFIVLYSLLRRSRSHWKLLAGRTKDKSWGHWWFVRKLECVWVSVRPWNSVALWVDQTFRIPTRKRIGDAVALNSFSIPDEESFTLHFLSPSFIRSYLRVIDNGKTLNNIWHTVINPGSTPEYLGSLLYSLLMKTIRMVFPGIAVRSGYSDRCVRSLKKDRSWLESCGIP